MPKIFSRTYPLAPAIDEVAAAVAERRRRVSYPKWFVRSLALRQVFASPAAEKKSGAGAAEAIREYDRLVEERGTSAASASERTRELAGI
jgi:hypothetical protein